MLWTWSQVWRGDLVTEDKTFRRFCNHMYMEYLQEEHDIGNDTDVMSSEEYRTKHADYLEKRYKNALTD